MNLHPLEHYHYNIREENIGKSPAEPRDSAKLLVYDTKQDKLYIDRFFNIRKYLPKNALLVLNNTGVIPARIVFSKDTGGKVEGLVLYNEGIQKDGTISVIVNKKIIVGRKLFLGDCEFLIQSQNQQYFYLKPNFNIELLPEILEQYGTTPIPKYLGKIDMDENKLRTRYQTVFSKTNNSVAAPTASLHFSESLIQSILKDGIEIAEVNLGVGMGTFAEVADQNIQTKTLHTEPIFISSNTRNQIYNANKEHKPIVAVGTTAIRTLESQSKKILSDLDGDIETETNIFIMPEYHFKIADILVTNFHVPRSSLMALVDAFLQNKKSKKTILELYQYALENEFKFFSFGDSMMIL